MMVNIGQGVVSLNNLSNILCAAGCIINDVDWLRIVIIIWCDHNFGIFVTELIDHNWLNFDVIN